MKPIERLFEREGLPYFGLPAQLATMYGGDFGLQRPALYANFVSSVDGVVALASGGESGRVVSGDSEPDRFIMGLLRAVADAVLIGAGTFRKAKGDLWYPESICPAQGALFANLRKQLGLRNHPLLVVVTTSGNLDATQPGLRECLIVTTPHGEARLRGQLPAGARISVFDAERIQCRSLMERLRAEGLQSVLTEGGPTLVGQLFDEKLVDELFLTRSPLLFGRRTGDGRKSLAAEVDLGGLPLRLSSVRRHESHLFLRYARPDSAISLVSSGVENRAM